MEPKQAAGGVGERSLGTDPWQTEQDSVLDSTVWEDRRERVYDALDRFDAKLDRALTSGDESGRLREVVRRLELRVYELEARLADAQERNVEAADRVGKLLEELKVWKQNAPST